MAMRLLPRWERGAPGSWLAARDSDVLAYERLRSEIEASLRSIDFDEVTLEDRVSFVERAAVWQMRQAIRANRFDLALWLHKYAVERIAEIGRGRARPALSVLRREGG